MPLKSKKTMVAVIAVLVLFIAIVALLLAIRSNTETKTTQTSETSETLEASEPPAVSYSENLLLHYSFDQAEGNTVIDESGHGQDGLLIGSASWDAGRNGQALSLQGGYVKLPNGILAEQKAITIATWVQPSSLATWSRIFDIGSSLSSYMFFTLNNGSSIQLGLHSGDTVQSLSGAQFPGSDSWQHVAVTLEDKTAIIYINGIEVIKNTNLTITPDQLGVTTANYIGKSQYTSDPNYQGKMEDFRIYNRALDESEIMTVIAESMDAAEAIALDKHWLSLGNDTSEVTGDLELPLKGPLGTTISWTSSDPAVLDENGAVTRPAAGGEDANVTLTATLTMDHVSDTKQFNVVIWPEGAVAYQIDIDAGNPEHEISPTLYGLFYEDINYAADGGLYGELIQNRSFEFSSALYSWTKEELGGGTGTIQAATASPLNDKNHKYVEVTVTDAGEGVGLANAGYTGIAVEAGSSYDFSVYAKTDDLLQQPLTVELRGNDNTVYGSCSLPDISSQWQQTACTLTSDKTDHSAKLVVLVHDQATVALDMVSLFPQKTWNNRSNGLRYDLAQLLDDMEPGFLRFPGGCIVEGGSLDNHYRWENTIGDVAERETQRNQWAANYYQSFGLGYHEYFQLAEDIGAEPLPVLFVGIESCTANPATIPLTELQPYIDKALNLIEYANGDATTEWGAVRAANGHSEPFNLKYLGIGNELWGAKYYERYKMFYDAIKEKYPDMKLIFSAGAFPNDAAYSEAYHWLSQNNYAADLVDEHMYQSPAWMLDNVDRYDDFSRTGSKVFVGEYAAHGVGKRNNMESAITEAAFMTGLERNSDIVEMAAYAPLFSRLPANYTQWTPDMIWFDQYQAVKTPNYYVQKLFMNHTGDKTLPVHLTKRSESVNHIAGSIMLSTWATQAQFDNVKITSTDGTGLYANDFSDNTTIADFNAHTINGSSWAIEDGVLKQTGTGQDTRLMLAQGQDWTNYTLELEAKKTSGSEGFLIGFAAKDANNYYWLNLGGWGNSRSVIEKAVNGSRSTISEVSSQTIEMNKTYKVKIVVAGAQIRTYLDGELMFELNEGKSSGPLYSSATVDEATGDIIVKVVNTSANSQYSQVNVAGAAYLAAEATAFELASSTLAAENSFEAPNNVEVVEKQLSNVSSSFHYEFPAYSVSVIRLRTAEGAAISQINDVTLSTDVGIAPSLPSTVEVTKSDGTKETVAVNWKKVDIGQYSKPGMFAVKGAVAGTYLKAVANVTVTAAANAAPTAAP